MTLLRTVTPQDLAFLISVSLFALATLGFAADRERAGYATATVGWGLFAGFWATTVVPHLAEARTIHAGIVVVTVAVSLYVATLAARRREPVPRLTLAFVGMAALYVPFQFVDPIHRAVLAAVTAHSAWLLSSVGFHPEVALRNGAPTVIFFPRRSLFYRIDVVAACSGISAMSLFAGLIAASRTRRHRRLAGAIGVVALIYVLNVVRVVFVAGALAGTWFAGASGISTALYGVADPMTSSYLLAEHVVSQVLVVAVLFGVYLALLRWFPDLQSVVGGLVEQASHDSRRLRDALAQR